MNIVFAIFARHEKRDDGSSLRCRAISFLVSVVSLLTTRRYRIILFSSALLLYHSYYRYNLANPCRVSVNAGHVSPIGPPIELGHVRTGPSFYFHRVISYGETIARSLLLLPRLSASSEHAQTHPRVAPPTNTTNVRAFQNATTEKRHRDAR